MSAQMSSVPDSGAPPTDKWWLLAILGLLSIATGFLALLWPGPTLLLIGIWFGVLLIMVGAGDLATAFAPGSSTPRRLVAAILGVITIFAGTMLLFRPGASVLTAAWVLGFWFVVTGILQLVQGLSHHESRLWNLLFGLIGIAAGAIILGSPRIGLQTLRHARHGRLDARVLVPWHRPQTPDHDHWNGGARMNRATLLGAALTLTVSVAGCGASPEDKAQDAGQRIGASVAKIQTSTSAQAVGEQIDAITRQLRSIRAELPAAYNTQVVPACR